MRVVAADERRCRLGSCPRPAWSRPGRRWSGFICALSQNPATLREGARGCWTIRTAGDARRVADMIGIPFTVWDMAAGQNDVVDDFVAEYPAGRPPTPCLVANEKSSLPRC